MSVRFALGLVAVALALLGIAALLRRRRGATGALGMGRLIAILESTVVGPGVVLHVVRIGRRWYVLGAGSAGVSRIAEISRDDVEHAQAERGAAEAARHAVLVTALQRVRRGRVP